MRGIAASFVVGTKLMINARAQDINPIPDTNLTAGTLYPLSMLGYFFLKTITAANISIYITTYKAAAIPIRAINTSETSGNKT